MDCSATDHLCLQINGIVDALNDPWDGFLGVLLATLIGAVIGAGAAYGFALMLRRQQKKDEIATRAATAETERLHRLDDNLRLAATALADLARTYVVYGTYSTPVNHAELLRAQWAAAAYLRTTRLSMSPSDRPVLDAAFEYLRNLHTQTGAESTNADRLSRVLLVWRSGERSTDDTVAALNRWFNPLAPNE